ncbi:response regulator [Massilia sp.]|uniref:response regulator n=1 Tax=Massilia sp. TaxID=1882437 RepID=UPI00289D0FAA|nr:response regulator [Massilia sp.]
MQDNGNLAVLVVDPNPGMRTSLQNMLGLIGIGKVEYAINANTAIKQLTKRAYDVVLCEYDLASGSGEGQDGQQLLEDLRHHHLISASTIFIMLTSEGVYNKVVSAAELTPTDYVLKPFTVELLSGRIKRALERRAALLPAWQQAAAGKLREAIRTCEEGEKAQPRYAFDFARIRAELHTTLEEHQQAANVYRQIMTERPLGWAALGLARCMVALNQIDDARFILDELLISNPRMMAAYDLLARCLETEGEGALAKKVLEDAVAISPHVVRRLRKLGEVALATGDAEGAEKSFKQVVTKARYSEFRDPEDHVNLVKALVTRGDMVQATGVIRDLERSLRGSPAADACKSYATSLLHDKTGNGGAAAAELQAAVNAVRASSGLSSGLKMEMARACLDHQLDAQAADVMMTVMHDAQSGVSVDQAMGVFDKAGRGDLVEGMGQQLKAQAQILLGVADEKRNMGDVRGAVQTLLEALHIAPNNLQIMVATAGGILRQMNELGWDHPLGQTAGALLDGIRAQDALHPRLAVLVEEYQAARRKYGIAA